MTAFNVQFKDIFRPAREPARAIYDALMDEATMRKTRTVDEWIAAEELAVLNAATAVAEKYGLTVPTMEQVRSAERCARGSADYCAKWVTTLTNMMTPRSIQ